MIIIYDNLKYFPFFVIPETHFGHLFYYNQYIKRKMSYENEEYELEWGDGDQNEGWD